MQARHKWVNTMGVDGLSKTRKKVIKNPNILVNLYMLEFGMVSLEELLVLTENTKEKDLYRFLEKKIISMTLVKEQWDRLRNLRPPL